MPGATWAGLRSTSVIPGWCYRLRAPCGGDQEPDDYTKKRRMPSRLGPRSQPARGGHRAPEDRDAVAVGGGTFSSCAPCTARNWCAPPRAGDGRPALCGLERGQQCGPPTIMTTNDMPHHRGANTGPGWCLPDDPHHIEATIAGHGGAATSASGFPALNPRAVVAGCAK